MTNLMSDGEGKNLSFVGHSRGSSLAKIVNQLIHPVVKNVSNVGRLSRQTRGSIS